jgi:hypothetical protein
MLQPATTSTSSPPRPPRCRQVVSVSSHLPLVARWDPLTALVLEPLPWLHCITPFTAGGRVVVVIPRVVTTAGVESQSPKKYKGWERMHEWKGWRCEGLDMKVSEHEDSVINARCAPLGWSQLGLFIGAVRVDIVMGSLQSFTVNEYFIHNLSTVDMCLALWRLHPVASGADGTLGTV